MTCLFALIGSELIDTRTYTQACYQIVCGTYPNRTYKFDSPVGLWKVAARVPVGFSYFFASIDCFDWYKNSLSYLYKPYLIVDLCVSYLLDPRSLNLNLVLGCIRKLSVGRIQNGHTNLTLQQVCGRSWRWCRFLWFHLSPSIHWLDSRQLLISSGIHNNIYWYPNMKFWVY